MESHFRPNGKILSDERKEGGFGDRQVDLGGPCPGGAVVRVGSAPTPPAGSGLLSG
jgi:hypothetical protein